MTGKHLSVVPDASTTIAPWNAEQRALIVDQLMRVPADTPPPTDSEIELFAARCRALALDPFAGQIHAVFRKDKRAPLGRTMAIQTGIDGYRLTARRSRDLDRIDGPYWCGPDGAWRDVWLDATTPPAAAKVAVVRGGQEFVAVATWREFAQTYDGTPQGLWSRMPAHMLGKVAEAHALRRAFPNELGGVYTDDEMSHRDVEMPPALPPQPVRDSVVVNGQERREIADAATAAGLTSVEASAVVLGVCGVESSAQVPRNRLGDVLVAFAEVEARRAKDPPDMGTAGDGSRSPSPADDPPEEAHGELFAPDAKPGQYEQDAS